MRDQLLDMLVEYSYQYSAGEQFKLASGGMSRFYVNCKTTTMRRAAGPLIAAAFEPSIPPGSEVIGGLTMGADPIAYAVRDYAQAKLDVFVVRKAAKDHGLERLIEGPIGRGMKVVIVDDVVTTGGSTIIAIEECVREGLEVVAVIALIDRQEDSGLAQIAAKVACP